MPSTTEIVWSIPTRYSHGLTSHYLDLETPPDNVIVAPHFIDPTDNLPDGSVCQLCVDPKEQPKKVGCFCSQTIRPGGLPAVMSLEFSDPIVAPAWTKSGTREREAYYAPYGPADLGNPMLNGGTFNNSNQAQPDSELAGWFQSGSGAIIKLMSGEWISFSPLWRHVPDEFKDARFQPPPEESHSKATMTYTTRIPGCSFHKLVLKNFRTTRPDIPRTSDTRHVSDGIIPYINLSWDECAWYAGSGELQWNYSHMTVLQTAISEETFTRPPACPTYEGFTVSSWPTATSNSDTLVRYTWWQKHDYLGTIGQQLASRLPYPPMQANSGPPLYIPPPPPAWMVPHHVAIDWSHVEPFTVKVISYDTFLPSEKVSGSIELTNYDPYNAVMLYEYNIRGMESATLSSYVYATGPFFRGDTGWLGAMKKYGLEVRGKLDQRVGGPSTNPRTDPTDLRVYPVDGVPLTPTLPKDAYGNIPWMNVNDAGIMVNSYTAGAWNYEATLSGYSMKLRIVGRCFVLDLYGCPPAYDGDVTASKGRSVISYFQSAFIPISNQMFYGGERVFARWLKGHPPYGTEMPIVSGAPGWISNGANATVTAHGKLSVQRYFDGFFGTPNWEANNPFRDFPAWEGFGGGVLGGDTNPFGPKASVPWAAPFITQWGCQGINHLASWISAPVPCTHSGKVTLRKAIDFRMDQFKPPNRPAPAGPQTFPEFAYIDLRSAT